MSMTGTVKKWSEDKGFGFILPDDGDEKLFIHCRQLVDTETLQQGDVVSFDKEYDDRKGKIQGIQLHRDIQWRRWRWRLGRRGEGRGTVRAV